MVAEGCLPEQRLVAELVRGAREGCWLLSTGALPERAQEAPLGATLALGFPQPSVSIVSAVGGAEVPRPPLSDQGLSPSLAFFLGTALCPRMESSVDSPFTRSHP